jgi:hypothetical protein
MTSTRLIDPDSDPFAQALELKAGSAANVKGSALNVVKSGESNYGYLFSVVFATWLVSNAMIDVSLCFMLCRQLMKIKR